MSDDFDFIAAAKLHILSGSINFKLFSNKHEDDIVQYLDSQINLNCRIYDQSNNISELKIGKSEIAFCDHIVSLSISCSAPFDGNEAMIRKWIGTPHLRWFNYPIGPSIGIEIHTPSVKTFDNIKKYIEEEKLDKLIFKLEFEMKDDSSIKFSENPQYSSHTLVSNRNRLISNWNGYGKLPITYVEMEFSNAISNLS